MNPDQPNQPAPAAPQGPLRLTLGDALIGAGGLLIFIFSFAPFVQYNSELIKRSIGGGTSWWDAWSNQTFMAPLTWWVIGAGILLVLLALSRTVWAPERERLGFRPSHLGVGLSLFAFFVLVGYAFSAKTLVFGIGGLQDVINALGNVNPGFSWGGVMMLFGSVVALVGAFMNHLALGGVIYPRPHAALAMPAHDPNEAWPGGPASPATYGTFHPADDAPTPAGGHEDWPGGAVEPPSWAGPRSDQPVDNDSEDGSSPQR
jgi:hypothetical protein